jgi:hypothetical protein
MKTLIINMTRHGSNVTKSVSKLNVDAIQQFAREIQV